METKIKISKLDPEDEESILKIANWYYEEWNTPIDKTVNRLTNQLDRDTIFQLVLTVEKRVMATGGLCNKVNLFSVHKQFKKYNPWVALLYTQKDYRNKGFGTMLLNQIEYCATQGNISKIYLYTFTAEALYKKNGWAEIDRVMYKGHDTAIMEKTL